MCLCTEEAFAPQNGVTHEDAGDSRAAEVSSVLKSNDPDGFSVVEVRATCSQIVAEGPVFENSPERAEKW